MQAIDAATKEQADEQPMLVDEEENAEPLKEDEEVPMDIDEEELQVIYSIVPGLYGGGSVAGDGIFEDQKS